MTKQGMLILIFLILSVSLLPGEAKAPEFREYFENQTLRVDYFHIADKTTEIITIDRLYSQGVWAGNPHSLMDPFNNGRYYVHVHDRESGQLIYSRGFDSYCGEYMTTGAAAKGIKRTYHETVLVPFPKKEITFKLMRRDRTNSLNKIFQQEIDPKSIDIDTAPLAKGVKLFKILENGSPHHKVDIAILGEGYTADEVCKFEEDLEKSITSFLSFEPYKSRKKSFNITGVFKPSQDSGADEPTRGIHHNTPYGCTFNALGLSRYMLTEANRAIRDAAAHVPYDIVVLMVNNSRYGGGGIYNFYCIFTMDDVWHGYLFNHEFGHAFGGLADEYYSSTVAYNEFYPKGVEPTEVNITALLDPDNIKWKHLLTDGIEIPTPWEKEAYDQMGGLDKRAHREKEEYRDKVGAFEGAGYSSNGLYRSQIDCIMFSKSIRPFCKVCREGLIRVIAHYTKKNK